MKVFNLTDVSTPLLIQRGFINHTFAVGPALLEPGECVDVAPEHIQHIRAGLQRLVEAGAIAMGQAPPGYVMAKERAKKVAALSR